MRREEEDASRKHEVKEPTEAPTSPTTLPLATRVRTEISLQKNPLEGMTDANIIADADAMVEAHNLETHLDAFRKGALLARVQSKEEGSHEDIDMLTAQEKEACKFEIEHKAKSLAKMQILQASLCAACAIVQGMDQTVINGAQVSLIPTPP